MRYAEWDARGDEEEELGDEKEGVGRNEGVFVFVVLPSSSTG